MLLGNQEILSRVKRDSLIEPFREENLQPASYDLTLGNEFLSPRPGYLELQEKPEYLTEIGHTCLLPGKFCLATTLEWLNLPLDLAGKVEGRSSVGRLGITAHVTAGFVDPGFKGRITLEIANHGPNTIKLVSGMRIAQIAFELVQGCTQGYQGKYQNQKGVTGSKLYEDFQKDG